MNLLRDMSSVLVLLAAAGCGASVGSPTASDAPPPGPASASVGVPAAPAPDALAIDTEGRVGALVTTKTSVCWTSFRADAPRTSLVACSGKNDGKRAELVRDTFVHPGLAAIGEELYWSTDVTASIEHAPASGGAPAPFVTKSGPHGRFVVTRGAFYWTVDAGQQQNVLFTASAGSPPTEAATLGGASEDLLAVVEYTVYDRPVAFWFGNGVQRVHTGSEQVPERVAGDCFYPVDLAADSERAYWSCEDGAFHWVDWRGGAEHVERDAGWGDITTFEGAAYVVDGVRRRVLRLRPSTSTLEVVKTGLDEPTQIAVDESGLYVGERRTIRHYSL